MPINHQVEWQEAYSVGSALMDNHHKELVRMTNELFRGCERNEDVFPFLRTIQNAVNYAKTHFSVEERIMQKINYPEYSLHKAEHESFVLELLKQMNNFEQGKCTSLDFALFLKNWLLNHIAVTDKKYSPFFKNIKEEEFTS